MAKRKAATAIAEKTLESSPVTSDVIASKATTAIVPFLYTTTEEIIRGALARYDNLMTLKTIQLEDEQTYMIVRRARLDLREIRCAVGREREAAKAPVLEEGRLIDGRAKALTALIEPREEFLFSLESQYDAAKEKAIQDELDAREEMRRNRLELVGGAHTGDTFRHWGDDAFEAYLSEARAFNDRKRSEQEAIEQQKKELAEKQKKIDEERAELEREKAARQASATPEVQPQTESEPVKERSFEAIPANPDAQVITAAESNGQASDPGESIEFAVRPSAGQSPYLSIDSCGEVIIQTNCGKYESDLFSVRVSRYLEAITNIPAPVLNGRHEKYAAQQIAQAIERFRAQMKSLASMFEMEESAAKQVV